MIDYLSLASGLDDAFAAAPLLVLALAGIVCLFVIAFAKRTATTVATASAAAGAACAIGLALAIAASVGFSLPMMPRRIGSLLSMDGLSFVGTMIILVSSLAIALASRPYLARREGERGEYYALLLFATLGRHRPDLQLEPRDAFPRPRAPLGIALRPRRLPTRAARSGEGRLHLLDPRLGRLGLPLLRHGPRLLPDRKPRAVGDHRRGRGPERRPLMTAAFALMGVGFAFKLAIVPFHMWALEVYEGSSAPVAALIATVSKAAMALPLIRILAPLAGTGPAPAARQGPSSVAWISPPSPAPRCSRATSSRSGRRKVKRMLAGSSIAQLGYVLAALVAGGAYGASAALFYLAAYSLSTLGAFACVAAISPADRDAGSRHGKAA